VLVCGFHHKLVHEYGWDVELDVALDTTTWFRPNGRRFDIERAPPEQLELAA
jgi:hypothetical protein